MSFKQKSLYHEENSKILSLTPRSGGSRRTMALVATAETAQDVGSALSQFLDPVADASADITLLIAECFSTSSALRRLEAAIADFPDFRRHDLVRVDVQTVKESLRLTFGDVQRIVGGLGRYPIISAASYRQTWRELAAHFQEQSNNTLTRRLRFYQSFLDDLRSILIEG